MKIQETMNQLNLLGEEFFNYNNVTKFKQDSISESIVYLHGKCHIFAEALKNVNSLKLCFLIGYSDFYLDLKDYSSLLSAELIHVFCFDEASGKLFDIRGQISILEIEDYFEVDISDKNKFAILSESSKFGIELDLNEFKKDLINKGFIEYCKDEISFLEDFVRRYADQYR